MDEREEVCEPLSVSVLREILPNIPLDGLQSLHIPLDFHFLLSCSKNGEASYPIGLPCGSLSLSAKGIIIYGGYIKFEISSQRSLTGSQPTSLLPIRIKWSVMLKQDYNPNPGDDNDGQIQPNPNNGDGGQQKPNSKKQGVLLMPTANSQRNSTLHIDWTDLRIFDLNRDIQCLWNVQVEAYPSTCLAKFENRASVLFQLITDVLGEQGNEIKKQGKELVEHNDQLTRL